MDAEAKALQWKSTKQTFVEPESMDIRQLLENKPGLGRLVELRFGMLHHHRKIAELEPLVIAHLKANGPVKIVTRAHRFEFDLDSEGVSLTIQEGRKLEGLPYQSAPNTLQVFCNEAVTLHTSQQLFRHLTEDEVRQLLIDFQDLAGPAGLFITKGRHRLWLQIEGAKLHFRDRPV